MSNKMAMQSRKDLVSRMREAYQAANKTEKKAILDEIVVICEYDRKYAIKLLNRDDQAESQKNRTRKRKYDVNVERALYELWLTANQICSKRLVPFIPDLIDNMEGHGHMALPLETHALLKKISPATVDRILRPARHRMGKSVSTTCAGNLLKHQIRIRTFADWDDVVPGFFEADLVAHCGGDTRGTFINTLVLIDIATAWLEFFPLLQKSGGYVIEGLDVAKNLLPFPLLGLDTDNGSEFINHELISYCQQTHVTFTRSRAYKKNDQAYVEEKNGSVIRRMIGYDRYEGRAAWLTLCKLYRQLRLYVNFFQPSVKLLEKHRDGSHVMRRYDRAKTPYQRVLDSCVDSSIKYRLTKQYNELDAVDLLHSVQISQQELQKFAIGEFSKSEPGDKNTLQYYLKREKKDGRKGPHHWRTRKDPFEGVTAQINQLMIDDPHRSASGVLRELMAQYPNQFRRGHIRSMQRRVNEWRQCNPERLLTLKHPMLD